MDYEDQAYQNLSISVQNEAPFFSCTIKKRPQDALWEVDRFFETPGTSDPQLYKSIPVTINVEDVNDPPIFIPPVNDLVVMENMDVGAYLTTISAKDLDGAHANTFRYIKGEDVDDWITVDEKTGNISTAKILDRESQFMINGIYKATVLAVDDGVPPLTGTGTLHIHLQDQNDNAPMLNVKHVDMCSNMEPTTANISAVDLDLPPYSSPFNYELLGDVVGKWRIDPAHDDLRDCPEYMPYQYNCEPKESDCGSLAISQLTDNSLGDNLEFLKILGPKFNTLGEICQQSMTRKISDFEDGC
ncbi:Cadherin-2 Neural cadherin [Triplophysa tibetana]|uniref:Cadherin-2 Neural cadherin n=1 Tax=Triplophysa tibetana TaxID=1572043 RepID=A0A5A9NC50_9TELE|nr:Cadherin-2 Neural cadherin [Triplophysa tibetana]